MSRTSRGSSRRSGSMPWTSRSASTARSTRRRSRRWTRTPARWRPPWRSPDRVTAGEVMATFRAIADIQAEYGSAACHRYVISFTRGAQDVLDVLELASRVGRPAPVLDVVPLFESADALGTAGPIVEQLLADPRYRRHLAARGDHQEVMLGYSDSTKESGTLAASWMLYQAQASLAAVAATHRRGADDLPRPRRRHRPGRRADVPRHPVARAGVLRGRLKLTEQGEVIAARYANPQIALRHLERLANAVLLASSPAHEAAVRDGVRGGRAGHGGAARRPPATAFRATVWEDPGFEAFFRAATPIEELAGPGHRLPARGAGARRRPAASHDGHAARHPVGLLVVPVAPQPARLVRGGQRARGVPAAARRGRPGAAPGAVPRLDVLRHGAGHRGAEPGQGVRGGRRAVRGAGPTTRRPRRSGRSCGRSSSAPGPRCCASPAGGSCWTRCPSCSARSPCATPTWTRCPRSRCGSSPRSGSCREATRGAPRWSGSSTSR